MQNKKLEKEILNSIKDFKIIAHGNDQEIVDRIVEVIRINLNNEIKQEIRDSEFEHTEVYRAGILNSLVVINNLLNI